MRNYSVLIFCLLFLNILEEVAVYKLHRYVRDPYLRTGMYLLMFTIGFALATVCLAPWIKSLLEALRRTSKKNTGMLGPILFYGSIVALLFVTYYITYNRGPQYLLPPAWR